MLAIPFPDIDPVLIEIGPFAIRWYALAYIAGLIIGWRYIVRLIETEQLWGLNAGKDKQASNAPATPANIDDFLVWAALGVILGGRIGYVLFYQPAYFIENPAAILAVWQGGMSFHGGLIGMIAAIVLFSRYRELSLFSFGDLIAAATPIGLFFGRLANFINGELFGRPSDAPWAMVFPRGGPLPRHPSQLYEAFLEGIVLFLVLRYLTHHTDALKHPGTVIGSFFIGYGLARIISEFFREPDAHLGFLFAGTTMGMLLSLPMLAIGAWFVWQARRSPAAS